MNDYGFLFLTLVYGLSSLSFIILVIIGVICLIEFICTKKLTQKPVKYTAAGICALGIILSLPWWFIYIAYNTNNLSYYQAAVDMSVFPKVKKHMYSELGGFYFNNYDGANALKYSIKAQPYENKYPVCLLYTISGDYKQGAQYCKTNNLDSLTADNYIMSGEYKKALESQNKAVNNYNHHNYPNYSQMLVKRAFIYKKLGRYNFAQKDYDEALELCTQNKCTPEFIQEIKSVYGDDNYYQKHYSDLKKKFKFN